MNPLFLKVGLPVAIIGILAFMRWTNKKSMGEPFFPTSDTQGGSSKGGGIGLPGLGKLFGADTGNEPSLNSPNEVLDSGTFFDGGGFTDESSDSTDSGGTGTTDAVQTDNVLAAPSSLRGVTAGHTGANVGGVSFLPAFAQNQQIATIQNANPSFVPYSPTPTTNLPINQFGGGASAGRSYAI